MYAHTPYSTVVGEGGTQVYSYKAVTRMRELHTSDSRVCAPHTCKKTRGALISRVCRLSLYVWALLSLHAAESGPGPARGAVPVASVRRPSWLLAAAIRLEVGQPGGEGAERAIAMVSLSSEMGRGSSPSAACTLKE